MNRPASSTPTVLRDQARARHAYSCLAKVAKGNEALRQHYTTAVNDLGANIMRSGLCAALAELQRVRDRGGDQVLEHLASAGIPELAGATKDDLVCRVHKLKTDDYIRASREMLRVAAWLKRAAQSLLEED
jgi:CRISPR-associated protein Cmr5